MKLTGEVENWTTLTTGPAVAALVVDITVEFLGLTKTFKAGEIIRKQRAKDE